MRQIVPAQFSVAFNPRVDLNAAVDWKGGKAWKPTLADALRPLGLMVSVQDKAVTIADPSTSR